MWDNSVDKVIGMTMQVIVQEIHIKITHTKNTFILFGYFSHNLVYVIVFSTSVLGCL